MFIQDTVFKTTPGNHILTIQGLTLGNGDYFFAHGTEETGGDNTIKYGWIMKVSNEGEILWNKLYRNNDFADDRFHFIEALKELDNGDIFTSGRVRDENGRWRIWIMGLNQNGCFGSTECGDIVSSTVKTTQDNYITVFPNPSSSTINLPDYDGELDYKIIDIQGKTYRADLLSANRIDISKLPSGLYFIIFVSDNKIVGKNSFVKE